MIAEAEGRRDHLLAHIAELDAGLEPASHEHTLPSASRTSAALSSPK